MSHTRSGPKEDLPFYNRWLNDFARRGDIWGVTPEIERRSEESVDGFAHYFMDPIRERRKRPQEDLMTILTQTDEARGKLSYGELVATCVLLVHSWTSTCASTTR
jgi:hypothetical protein